MTSDDLVAAFIAAGGKVQRCPTAAVAETRGVEIKPDDRARLVQQRLNLAAARLRRRRAADAAAWRLRPAATAYLELRRTFLKTRRPMPSA